MIKSITIGQYYPTDSIIHRIDPRVKLAASFGFIIMLFVINSFFGYALAATLTLAVMLFSKVPPLYALRGLRAIILIIAFTTVLNVFFTPGETELFQIFGATVTQEGVFMAARTATRLILLIIGSSMLTLTTTSIELTEAIEFSLKPFKKIGVPAHEIAMMMTIALRFIPTLTEEMDKIMKAQASRGADFDTGGLIKKAKALVPVLVPLFISAFRRADELATAMESRCYRGDVGRTKMKQTRLSRRDYAAIALGFASAAGLYGTNFIRL